MRITYPLRRAQAIREVQGNVACMAELNTQIATGKRFTRAAQDPLSAASVMRVQRDLRALDQYGKNGTGAQVRLGAEEAVVSQMQELLRPGPRLQLARARIVPLLGE